MVSEYPLTYLDRKTVTDLLPTVIEQIHLVEDSGASCRWLDPQAEIRYWLAERRRGCVHHEAIAPRRICAAARLCHTGVRRRRRTSLQC